MATDYYDGFFSSNPPTYPGYLPWRLTGLLDIAEISNSNGDYRIDPEQLPSSNLAVRLDLFGEVDVTQFFGPIVPLPSALLTGAFFVTSIEMNISYWNWLTTGFAGRTSFLGSEVERQFSRPMTFNYSVSDEYKETVHYGADVIFIAIVRSTGTVEVVRVSSFLGFLEHRTQSRMKKTRIDHAVINSVTLIEDDGVYKYLLTTDVGLEYGVEKSLEDINIQIYIRPEGFQNREENNFDKYETITVPLLEIRNESVFVVDAFQFSEGEAPSSTQDEWIGSIFKIDKSIQIEDPYILFSEREPYIEETDLGFQTQDQDISVSGDLQGILVNPQEYIPALNIAIDRVKESTAEDEEQEAQDQETIERLTALVEKLGSETPAVDDLILFPVIPEGEDPLGRDLRYILQTSRFLNKETIIAQIGIQGGTLSRQNFHSGNQDGQYVLKRDSEGIVHWFQIRQHLENGIFLLTNRSSTSWAELNDLLIEQGDVSYYTINTEKFWVVNDIETGGKTGFGSTTDLYAALFWSNFVGFEIDESDPENLQLIFNMEINDDSYYRLEQLSERYLTNVESKNDSVVSGWKKFRGWKLLNKIDGVTVDIESIESIDTSSGTFQIRVDSSSVPDDLIDIEEDFVELFLPEEPWWIHFGELFSIRSPFNYITSPRLEFNGLLSDNSNPPKLTFSGYYASAPLQNIEMSEEQNISLQEDSNVFYNFIDARPLYSSTVLDFKSLSYYYDESTDAGYILYTRDDDQSKSLYIRQGRVDFYYDIVEYLVYAGYPESLDIIASKTGSGTETQTMFLNRLGDHDIVGLLMNRSITDPPNFPVDDGKFDDTIWYIRLGDKILSFQSTSELENTIYSRKAYEQGKIPNPEVVKDNFVGSPASEIRFYKTYEPFSKKKYIRYQFAASTRTGDPEAGNGNTLSFVPVLTPLERAEFSEDSLILAVPHDKVVSKASRQALFPYRGGGERLILYVQDQGLSDQSITSTTAILNTDVSKSLTISDNDDYASEANPFGIDVNQQGVFMLTSTDNFFSYIGGGIYSPLPTPFSTTTATEYTAYQFPLLIAPNTTQASYVINQDRIGIAGYSKLQANNQEVTTLCYYEVNALKTASDTVYAVNTAEETSFLSANFYDDRQIALTTEQIEGVTGDAFVLSGLIPEPLSLASDGKNRLVVFQNGDNLDYIISSSEGVQWSYIDDIFIARSSVRVSAPSAQIHNDVLRLFYIEDKQRLMYKEISWIRLLAFHGRLLKRQSSQETNDEELDAAKQEFQSLLDNIDAKQVATTFEQQVDFTVNDNLFVTVIYFDETGLIQAARSTDSGDTWDNSPANY